MSSKKRRASRRKTKSRKHHHVLLILLVITAAIFFLHKEFSREDHRPEVPRQVAPHKKHGILPRISIVIDDLGPNKKAALEILDIHASFTFSILPHETYSQWIAKKAHSLGYDVIGHIPMEAKQPHKLGKGGLYTWMTDDEILDTLIEDINSIPHIKGISNHMGSAFTEDERVMNRVMTLLKEYELFFLDSITTPRSKGFRIAGEKGIKTIKRDIFLDFKDNPASIKAQWKKLVGTARKKGWAIAIAHPRKNTVEFFKTTLPGSKVSVVPLSDLVVSVSNE